MKMEAAAAILLVYKLDKEFPQITAYIVYNHRVQEIRGGFLDIEGFVRFVYRYNKYIR